MQDKKEDALKYIQEIGVSLSQSTITQYCNNEALNLILSFYADSAKEKQIRFSVSVTASSFSAFQITDLCSLLSNGLEAIHDGEVDSIVIAGMGGELVIHILTAGETVCRSAKELILQPQSEVSKVREYVRNTGYKIVDEDMILEDGKYYPMFRCVPCADNSAWDNMDETTVTVCDLYGPVLIKNGNPVLRKFLVREHHKLAAIMQQLRTQEMSDSIMDRIEQINEMMAYNEAAYSTMGAIRNAGI